MSAREAGAGNTEELQSALPFPYISLIRQCEVKETR